MNIEEKKPEVTNLISDATIIALMSAIFYLFAFAYEAGYLLGFKIPLYLIQIRLDTVLTIVLSSAIGLFFIMNTANFIAMNWPESPEIQFKISRIILFLIYPFWHFYIYGWRKDDIYLYSFLFGFMILFEFIHPLIVYRDKKTLKEKFIADEHFESYFYDKNLGSRFANTFGIPAYTVFFLAFIGTLLSYTAGGAKSVTQDEFHLLKDKQDVAIVRIYNDLLIGIGFDKNTMTLDNRLLLKKIDSEDTINLTLEKIGTIKKNTKKP